ncbi:MAG: ASKHA domain-containing protein [Pseudomonadota bacterium]
MTEQPSNPLVIFTPSGKRGRFPVGTPILAAARQLGVDLASACGGRGICATCQVTPAHGSFPKHGVRVMEGALSPWNTVEEHYDTKRGLAQGRRLGCQATVQGDVVIDVPAESQVHAQVVRKAADTREIALDPATRLYTVAVEEPDMHHPSGDLERLRTALASAGVADVQCPLEVLRTLQPALRKGQWTVTAAVHTPHDGTPARIVALWPGAFEGPIYGVAIDVGSTTIACHLCDLASGAVAVSSGAMNPQIRFGEDLMSRVSYVMMNPGGDTEMTRAVREALDGLIAEVATQAGIGPERILEGVLVGNPVMHHLLLGLDPTELGGAPFALATSEAVSLTARDLGLSLPGSAAFHVLPCIAGHVGADAAAVALAEAPQECDALTLVVDVGTNAEILLGDRTRVLACSSPTGPAFEGAQISAGQRAAPGAIERVRIDPATKEARFRIIGSETWSDKVGFDTTAVTGLCGSAIIEVIAEMRLAGIIDADGAIGAPEAVGSARVVADGRTYSYVLHDGRAEGGPLVAVTQADVRAIQLAKAALYAGARLLMDRFGVERVERVVLAGAFGAHISPLHAMVLGMIPDCPLDKVVGAGNAAGTGARMALLSRAARAEVERVVAGIEKVETAVEPRFQEHFVAAMAVPHKSDPHPCLDNEVRLPAVSFAPGDDGGGRRRRRRQTSAA